VQLVVGRGVHEDEVVAVLVQVGHVALVDVGRLDLGAGVERLVDDLARQHRLELGAHKGRALAGLDVLELDDRPQLVVEVEHEAVLQVVGRRHGSLFRRRSPPEGALQPHTRCGIGVQSTRAPHHPIGSALGRRTQGAPSAADHSPERDAWGVHDVGSIA
jgi:hypothetical protein